MLVIVLPFGIYSVVNSESPVQAVQDVFTPNSKQIVAKWEDEKGISGYEFFEDGTGTVKYIRQKMQKNAENEDERTHGTSHIMEHEKRRSLDAMPENGRNGDVFRRCGIDTFGDNTARIPVACRNDDNISRYIRSNDKGLASDLHRLGKGE